MKKTKTLRARRTKADSTDSPTASTASESPAESVSPVSDEIADFMRHTQMEGEIGLPIEVAAIDSRTLGTGRRSEDVARWVSVRPVGDARSYLGVYLGDLILYPTYYYHTKKKALTVLGHTNPAIFVPSLRRIVWGCESWWGFIDTPEQLQQISDADIQNVWYVKALKEMLGVAASESAGVVAPQDEQ